MKSIELKLGQFVYHQKIYQGKEKFKIVGFTENEVLLQGDWSGGTHDVCQSGWVPIKGLLKNKNTKAWVYGK